MNEFILSEENVVRVVRELAGMQDIDQNMQDEILQRFRELVNYRNNRDHIE